MVSNVVKLTQIEVQMAFMAGANRHIEAHHNGRQDSPFYKDVSGWEYDIEGAAAEMAYAKYRGKYWGGDCNTFKSRPDVDNEEVRSTHITNGSLIIRPDDSDDRFFVLVIGKAPVFRIVGYIKGKEAKKDCWWRSPNGKPAAWFVPQEALTLFG